MNFISRQVLPGLILSAATLASTTAAEFKLRTLAPEAPLGAPFDVVLETDDPKFDRQAIEKIEFRLDGDRWNQPLPWEPMDRERKIAPEQTEQWIWKTRLQGLDVGEMSLPETHVYLRSTGVTPGMKDDLLATTASIRILGVRDPADKSMDLAGLKPVRSVPAGWGWIWVAGAGAAGLAWLAWTLFKRLRAKRGFIPEAPREPDLPPGPWAMREFERRLALSDCKPGRAKDIDSHVSEVLRLYIARRFAIPALDMTTFECLRAMENQGIDASVVARARRFLDECDMVKFSKFEPPPARWDGIWEDARDIVRASTSQLEFAEGERILRDWAAGPGAAKSGEAPA